MYSIVFNGYCTCCSTIQIVSFFSLRDIHQKIRQVQTSTLIWWYVIVSHWLSKSANRLSSPRTTHHHFIMVPSFCMCPIFSLNLEQSQTSNVFWGLCQLLQPGLLQYVHWQWQGPPEPAPVSMTFSFPCHITQPLTRQIHFENLNMQIICIPSCQLVLW